MEGNEKCNLLEKKYLFGYRAHNDHSAVRSLHQVRKHNRLSVTSYHDSVKLSNMIIAVTLLQRPSESFVEFGPFLTYL